MKLEPTRRHLLHKARNGDFAFALLGWGSFSGDLALRSLVATPNADKAGSWNWGRGSIARVDDELLEAGFLYRRARPRRPPSKHDPGDARAP